MPFSVNCYSAIQKRSR